MSRVAFIPPWNGAGLPAPFVKAIPVVFVINATIHVLVRLIINTIPVFVKNYQGQIMLFNFFIWMAGKPRRADKSVPTDSRVNVFIGIIGPDRCPDDVVKSRYRAL